MFNTPEGEVPHDEDKHVKVTKNGRQFVVSKMEQEVDDTTEEWDSEEDTVGFSHGGITEEEEAKEQNVMNMKRPGSDEKTVELDPEPQLTADQYVFSRLRWANCANGIAESRMWRTRLVLD